MIYLHTRKPANLSGNGTHADLPAEVEGLDAGGVVDVLELGVGLEDVQHGSVGLPEELEPRHHHLPVGPLLLTLLRHGGKHDALGGSLGLKVAHLGRLHQRQLESNRVTQNLRTVIRRVRRRSYDMISYDAVRYDQGCYLR